MLPDHHSEEGLAELKEIEVPFSITCSLLVYFNYIIFHTFQWTFLHF